ncbi:ectomycorrhiza-regulated esterase [Amylocystis lapponica]|nr:ectomycorrhiza-regulated esterase [Amylocystis lapponica]
MAGTVTTSKKTTKISIPHPADEHGGSLTGVLEQLAPDEPTQGRKIALILHGALGHKDYLFQKRLALRLPLDSFRFDFRGNHESCGTWSYGNAPNDVVDIEVVCDYLSGQFGYVVDLVVGHSRGAVVGMTWLCTANSKYAKTVRGYVSAAPRFRMDKIWDNVTPEQRKFLDTQGYYEQRFTVARKPFVAKVTLEALTEFAGYENSYAWDRFPAAVDVLTMQGIKDAIVPVFDSIIYTRALAPRSPGTHTLCILEDADHNFTGLADEVVATILEWWHKLERKELQTGLWHTGLRGKL